ncbi:MAG: HAD family hydrolase [Prevotella sp.]
MKYRCLILDFDGTLGDTKALIVKTMQQTITELGLPLRTDAECAAMIGLPLKQTFTEMIPMSDEMGDKCTAVYRQLFDINNVPGFVSMFPHVAETIAAIHDNGVTITIASSRLIDSLKVFLEDMGLKKYISYVVSAGDVEHAKPAPDMVVKTLNALGFKEDEAIVVGDTRFDILMARNAGVKSIGVTYGNGKRSELNDAGADYIIDDFSEVLDIVSGK